MWTWAASLAALCSPRSDLAEMEQTSAHSVHKHLNARLWKYLTPLWSVLLFLFTKSSFLGHRADGASLPPFIFILPVFRNGSPPSVSTGKSYSCAKGSSTPSQMGTRPSNTWIISFYQPPGEKLASTGAEASLTTIRNLLILTGLLTQDIIR